MRQNNTASSLTEGKIYHTLLRFAVPFLLANFIQALYGAVDMAVIGWFSDAAGISAVSVGSQVMQIVTSLVAGLTMGGTILIAQYHGAGAVQDTKETIGTTLTMFGVCGLVFTVLMLLLTKPILLAMQTPSEAFDQAAGYVTVASCGVFFIFGYNAISAILRALGDSKSPLFFIAVACGINIVLDLLFVGGFHMGAAGAALATILSQGSSLFLAVVHLSRRDFIFSFRWKNFKIHQDKAWRILKIGLPVSLQESLVNFSFLFISAIANAMGVVASAAVGVAAKFESFAMLPAGAFSGAIASIAAQNIGAGKPERAKKSLNASILLAFCSALVFFLWSQLFPTSILQIFRAGPAVAAAGAQYLRTFSFDFLLVAFGFCQNGFLNGCGRTTFTMVNGVFATLVLRVPLAYALSKWIPSSLLGIGLAAPAATLVSVTVAFFYMRTGRWQKTAI